MKHLYCIICLIALVSCKTNTENTHLKGNVFGTTYNIFYNSSTNYQKQIDSLFYIINKSMSTYQNNSIISKVNRNESVEIDNHFKTVFNTSKEIYTKTNGVFDPTIGNLVNAWNFGPKGAITSLDSLKIDSLMQYVGLNKVQLKNNTIIKNKNTFLDFNAIAKGYAVDVISEFLNTKNTENYLVEIGGEIRLKGINTEKQKPWLVGLDKPRFDGQQSIFKAIIINNSTMATSGSYRKFKLDKNGNRFAHIINTKTGYPSKTNILSVSVIANNCMSADAYATAFQAMHIEAIKAFLKNHPELQVFIIFENDKKEFETLALNNFPV